MEGPFVLGVRVKNTIKLINDESEALNIVFQVVWLILFFLSVFNSVGVMNFPIYEDGKVWIWCVILFAFYTGFVVPSMGIVKKTKNVILPLLTIAAFLSQLCFIILLYGAHRIKVDPGFPFTMSNMISISTAIFASSSVAVGWFVHEYTQKNSLRKQHTVNVLNSSRMSEVYHAQSKEFNKTYSSKSITKADVDAYIGWRKGEKIKVDNADDFEAEESRLKQVFDSIEAAIYLLNYYEFICAGIHNEDLDEKYLKSTISCITVNLYDTCKELLYEFKRMNKLYYRYLDFQVSKWRKEIENEQQRSPGE